MRKTRIILASEFSQNATGYGNISKELLTRLAATNLFELAELAAFCEPGDPRIEDCPWKVYPVLPDKNNPVQIQEYGSHPWNSAGRYLWNEIALDFELDITLACRDPFMDSFLHWGPFRKFYNLISWCPIDATPLQDTWVADYQDSEVNFTYTDWGSDVLKRHGIPNEGFLPIGVNFDKYFPLYRKSEVKKYFGVTDETLIVGYVARNQPRKLISELFESFVGFLKFAPRDLARRANLYVHTLWPDVGWNIPQLLREYGLGNKVLFTYKCSACNYYAPFYYTDVGTICPRCNNPYFGLVNPNDGGLCPDDMRMLYNFMDLFLSVSTNEGLGIPVNEAAACGVPTACVDYSGTKDIINKVGAFPVKPTRLYREYELCRLIAIPDQADLIGKMIEVLSLPESLRRKIGFEQSENCRKYFNWDITVAKLIETFARLPQKNWSASPFWSHSPKINFPNNLNNEQFVYTLYKDVIGKPELFNRFKAQKEIYAITMSWRGAKPNFTRYNRDIALHEAVEDNKYFNFWENQRKQKALRKGKVGHE